MNLKWIFYPNKIAFPQIKKAKRVKNFSFTAFRSHKAAASTDSVYVCVCRLSGKKKGKGTLMFARVQHWLVTHTTAMQLIEFFKSFIREKSRQKVSGGKEFISCRFFWWFSLELSNYGSCLVYGRRCWFWSEIGAPSKSARVRGFVVAVQTYGRRVFQGESQIEH